MNVFVLISGYFGIKWKLKSFASLIFQTIFFLLLVYLALVAFGQVEYSNKTLLIYSIGSVRQYWFVESYLGLYLLSPVLNAFIKNTSRSAILAVTASFIIYEIFIELLGAPQFRRGYSIISFCGIYLIGRLINLYQDRITMSKGRLLMGFLASAAVICAAALYLALGRHYSYWDIQTSKLFTYDNPIVILEAVLLFCLFSKLKLRSSIINWISGSVFAVYLLHLHPLLKNHYFSYTAQLYDMPWYAHYAALLCVFIGVMLIAVLLDKGRVALFDYLYNTTTPTIKKWISRR